MSVVIDRFAFTPNTGKCVYAFVCRVHTMFVWACMGLYEFVCCTLTMSRLVNKHVDACLPDYNFLDSLRGVGEEGG